MFTKLRVQKLVCDEGYIYSGIIEKEGRKTIVYGKSKITDLWRFWEYSKTSIGLWELTTIDDELTHDDVIFKRDILIGDDK